MLTRDQEIGRSLRNADPEQRALLDLSMRRRVKDDVIAAVLRLQPEDVAPRREAALDRLAWDLGIHDEDKRAKLPDELRSLPDNQWPSEFDAPPKPSQDPPKVEAPAPADEPEPPAAPPPPTPAYEPPARPPEASPPAYVPLAAAADTPPPEPKPEKRRRRRGALWFLVLAGALIGAVLAIVLINASDDDKQSQPSSAAAAAGGARPQAGGHGGPGGGLPGTRYRGDSGHGRRSPAEGLAPGPASPRGGVRACGSTTRSGTPA